MNTLARLYTPAPVGAGYKLFALALLVAMLFGCGGDSGIDVGSGQSADPVVVDYPLFYVKRPLPLDDNGDLIQSDVRDLLPVQIGADLYMRDRAATSAEEVNLTGELTDGLGDVRDVSVSFDGQKVLFSMRFPLDPDGDEDDQPTWNIWEYSIPDKQLRRIFSPDLDVVAEEGHDVGPVYLPDGRLLFSSTRQNQSVAKLTDQGRPQFAALDESFDEPAFVLHVMNPDGSDIRQVSFNQSHDLYPALLDSGRIMFSRWDGAESRDSIALYTANPDGTDIQLLYGADTYTAPGSGVSSLQFLRPQELADGRVLTLTAPFSGTSNGGELFVINTDAYINIRRGNAANEGAAGPGQQRATNQVVVTVPGVSPGGRFNSAAPLWDGTNRAIVSYTICRLRIPPETDVKLCTDANLRNPLAVDAEPAYGVWLADLVSGEIRPIILPETGNMITEVAIAQVRPRPQLILDNDAAGQADPQLVDEGAGILHIRSVYDFDGTDGFGYATLADPALTAADERPARFVRIYKAVGIPDDETLDFSNSAFGVTNNFGMREIIGYAPVEPDGSVMVKVPADVPLSIDVLDRQGRRLFSRHQNWLQVRPGEVRECNGCHNPGLPDVSHGRSDAFTPVNSGAPAAGYIFPNTALGTSADATETMAQNRVRYSCFTDCSALELSMDLEYEDVWTDPAVRTPDLPFSLSYADLTDTELPGRNGCMPWTVDCRIIINYEQHIQPLWEVARPAIDPDPNATDRCIDCHALRDAADVFIDPDSGRGQLELTRDPSTQDAEQFKSYRELLSGDTAETLADGTVQELLVFQGNFDADGNPILEPVGVTPPLSVAGAIARPEFFTRFTDPGTHQGWLSPAELRLIAEWLDMGAQYFNNPFDPDVPVN